MKRVFSNSGEVCHVWAQQTQSEGRSSNCYFRDSVIYSYGSHYPLGIILTNKKGEKAVLINAAGYSVTTSKHIAQARYAVHHYQTQFSVENTELMRAIVNAHNLNENVTDYVINCANSLTSRLASEDAKKRKKVTLEKWRNETLNDAQNAISILNWLGGKVSKKAIATLEAIAGGDLATITERATKARKAAEAKRAREEKARLAALKEAIALAIPLWRKGEKIVQVPLAEGGFSNHHVDNLVFKSPDVFMRVNGEGDDREVQTSKFARFPLSHGLKALPLIRAVVAKGEGWQRNGHTIHLGHYQIDKIAPNGDITAGCHFVPYAEVERLAASVGA